MHLKWKIPLGTISIEKKFKIFRDPELFSYKSSKNPWQFFEIAKVTLGQTIYYFLKLFSRNSHSDIFRLYTNGAELDTEQANKQAVRLTAKLTLKRC